MFEHLLSRPREQATVAALLLLGFGFSLFASGLRRNLSEPSSPTPFRYRVDVNTAGPAELQTLPGIGVKLAEGIITLRETGRIGSHEELLDVKGIGPKKLEAMRPLLTEIPPSGKTFRKNGKPR